MKNLTGTIARLRGRTRAKIRNAFVRSSFRRLSAHVIDGARKRSRLFVTLAAALLCASALLISQGYLYGAGSLPGAEQVRNIMAMVSTRSPGERGEAELIKHRSAAAARPRQRALGKVFDNPGVGPGGDVVDEAVAALAPLPFIVPETLSSAPLETLSSVPPLAYGGGGAGAPLLFMGGGGGGGSTGGGGGGGGGSDTGPGPDTPETHVPTAPVPEPQTWVLLIVGFGLCGAALRRRHLDPRLRGCGA